MAEVEPRWKEPQRLSTGPRRIAARSKRRVDRQPERAAAVAQAMERAGGVCEYAHLVPEVACGWLPDRLVLEPDEIRGGARRGTEMYDPDRIRMVCPRHHEYKTENKRELIRRLETEETNG